jgi:hypothetical protein
MEHAREASNFANTSMAATDRKHSSAGEMRHARYPFKHLALPFNPALLYYPSCVVHRIEDINL